MYSVVDYGRMLGDRVRVDAYRAALAAAVRPGSVVIDLGAGPGFFSLEACRLGARKVYAIETNDAVQLLPALARRNGFADRIEVIQRPSTEVTLPEKADVLVADLRGVMPLFESNLSVMADARARLLAPGGVMIPARDDLTCALVEAKDLYDSLVGGWEGLGVDLSDARALSVNVYQDDRRHRIGAGDLATDAAVWSRVDYGEPGPELHEGTVELTAPRARTAHGVCVWFEARLLEGAEGARMSTAPGSDRIYSRGFFPLERPVELQAGDRVTLTVGARRGGDDHVWAWSTTVRRADAVVASYRQSNFLGLVLSSSSLAKEATMYTPALGRRGAAVAAILASMNGSTPLGDLARAVHAAHPGAFASAHEALEEARRLSRKYG